MTFLLGFCFGMAGATMLVVAAKLKLVGPTQVAEVRSGWIIAFIACGGTAAGVWSVAVSADPLTCLAIGAVWPTVLRLLAGAGSG